MSKRLIVLALWLVACRSAAPPRSAPFAAVAADTVRGVLVLEGSDPMPVPTLQTMSGRVGLIGGSADILSLSQLELQVYGQRVAGGMFRVSDFVVRSANGHDALDGVVTLTLGGFALRLRDGSLSKLADVPPIFDRLVGSRVWATTNARGSVSSFGMIGRPVGRPDN